ncbi:MAG TPA: hypothetical protein VFL15_06585 [Gammaproteobacteria bacterium]|nr:hypothetical protein [Gammaproteobacteria bacterium]
MKGSEVGNGLQHRAWWGEFSIAMQSMGCWHIGPLEIWAQHMAGEWRLAWRSGEELMQPVARVELDVPIRQPEPGMQICRFSMRETGKPLWLLPALADRPVVVRPETALSIPSGEEVTLFVSTTLWVAVYANPQAPMLIEMPSLRPSDTWFGPNTRQGELCYASRTLAHTQIENVVPRPHRAVTPVQIRNHGNEALLLERLSVPVPLLTLYQNEAGDFWTQSIMLERTGRDDQARLHLGNVPLPAGMAARQVAAPRQLDDDSSMFRALSRFFG